MTAFTTSANACGIQDAALQSAVTTLMYNGFAITSRDATSATLSGPGLNSTKQPPILGASIVNLKVDGNLLHLNAELGGVDSMQRFLIYFPLVLGLGLGLFFGVGGGFAFGQRFGVGFGVPWAQGWQWMLVAIGGSMLPVAPWVILSPLMAKMIRSRTQRALTTLVHNACYAMTSA